MPKRAGFLPSRRPGLRLLGSVAVVAAALLGAVVAVSPGAAAAPVAVTPSTTGGAFGPNTYIFDTSMTQSSIQSTLDSISAQQTSNQFGTQRYAVFFKPGTYGTATDPLIFSVGYYTSVAGLGQNPGDVTINGSIDVYNQCFAANNCIALDNFWRSMSNLTINVAGQSGCRGNTEFWAVSQAAPMRRVQVNGLTSLMDYCTAGPQFASGGFIADSKFTGSQVINGSQQQWVTRNTDLDGWSNGVWNQVFCGDPGAPAQSFGAVSQDEGGPPPYTTLATCPVTEEPPYLYTDASGNYRVFVPSQQTNSSGPSWAGGSTPGTSLPISSFYIATPANTVAQINAALAGGKNLIFTPGVYDITKPIEVTNANTKILGLGFPTLIPENGHVTMETSGVGGISISGLIFDAGAVNSPSLLTLGTASTRKVSFAGNPDTVSDVFFRIGGAEAGQASTAFIDNSSNSIIDDMWAWRADHGAGAGTWTGDQANTGVTVWGNNVTAYGLFVEHFQKSETIWNGEGGTVIFFQNENPYEVPSQSAWMASATQDGYPAFLVSPSVRSFQGYGMASYSFFNQGVPIVSSMAFQAPDTANVQFHDILTRFLNGFGGINSVINGTGAAVNSASPGASNVVSYP
jgi:hypothetical protein